MFAFSVALRLHFVIVLNVFEWFGARLPGRLGGLGGLGGAIVVSGSVF